MFDATVTDGITTGLDDLTRRLTAAHKGLGRDVARAGRQALLASVGRRRPGGLSFSGMGTKLGASTRTVAGAAGAVVFLDAVPAGAWAIAEHGRSAVRPVRKEALTIAGAFAASAKSTHGRPGLWAGAAGDIEAKVTTVIQTAYDTAMGV